jgi:23S rRNA-/tRNA-specific pseudouridylate synthase
MLSAGDSIALHASALSFTHPIGGRQVSFEVAPNLKVF